MTHACVLAVALSLFSPSPGPFMGFRLPYLYFFSCINTLAPLESSSVVTQPLMVCWLSEFRINSECSVLLFRALRYFSEISVSVCLPLASLCMNYLSFWVGFGSVGWRRKGKRWGPEGRTVGGGKGHSMAPSEPLPLFFSSPNLTLPHPLSLPSPLLAQSGLSL